MEIFFVILDKVTSAEHPVYLLAGALVFSTILCVLLALLLFKLHRRSSSQLLGKYLCPSVYMIF